MRPAFTDDEIEVRKTLIRRLRQGSDNYAELKGRDLCEMVVALVNFKLSIEKTLPQQPSPSSSLHSPPEETKFIDKELRILAKRCALNMGKMQNRTKEIVRDSFAKVDFYDKDLVEALKKYKMLQNK